MIAFHARIHSGLIEPPALHHALVILRDDAKPFVKRSLIAIENNDRNAGIGEGHRDAAAHRPGPDDAYALDFSRLHLVGKAGNFSDLPFREKGMNEPVALPVVQSLMKQLALTLETFAEWKLECAFDRGDAAERRMLTGLAPFDLFAFFVKNGRAPLRFYFRILLAVLGWLAKDALDFAKAMAAAR